MNNVSLLGRIVADPELKKTTSGKFFTSFTLAVNKNQNDADFIDIVAWEKTAEFICRYFNKGSQIALIGQISTRTYKDKQGNNRKAVEVVAGRVFFAGNKQSDAQTSPQYAPASEDSFVDVTEDEDLPF